MVTVTVLGSGSRGNCTLVQGGRTRVLLDAGFSRAEILRRLSAVGEDPRGISAIVVTHEHADHVSGVGPLSRKLGVPVACTEETLVHAGLADGGVAEWLPIEAGRPFDIGDLRFEPFSVPHDAVLTLGFRVRAEGLSIGYATDLGHVTPVVRDRLASVNVLVLESNHDLDMLRDGPYPWHLKQRVGGRHGHLSNDAAGSLLATVLDGEASVVALAHLSGTNNVPDLALESARQALERAGRERVRLVATSQDRPCAVLTA